MKSLDSALAPGGVEPAEAMKKMASEFSDRRKLVSVAKIWQVVLGQCC
jgi:hypothetical protein